MLPGSTTEQTFASRRKKTHQDDAPPGEPYIKLSDRSINSTPGVAGVLLGQKSVTTFCYFMTDLKIFLKKIGKIWRNSIVLNSACNEKLKLALKSGISQFVQISSLHTWFAYLNLGCLLKSKN